MFRKGALFTIVLSTTICSALFSWWVSSIFKYIPKDLPKISLSIVAIILIFMMYFVVFSVIFGAIYYIIHKTNSKADKYTLGCGINAIISLTALFKWFEHVNIYIGLIFVITAIGFIILNIIASLCKKNQSKEGEQL